MITKNRVKLKTSELFENFNFPEQSWSLPSWVANNDQFIEVLKDVISCNITQDNYIEPESFDEFFTYLGGRNYAIFEDSFVVCLSQGRLVYLTNSGFTKVSAKPELFCLSNWKIHL